MAKTCDFFTEKGSKYLCMAKQKEIGYDTYKDYCKYDDKKNCPIYKFFIVEKTGKI